MSRVEVTHGAMNGVKVHRSADEPLCEDCAEYHARWLEAHYWGPLDLRPCGTTAAYRRHQRHRERPCEPCRQANARRLAERDRSRKAVTSS